MKPVLIGSRALSHWLGTEPRKEADWDVISEEHISGTEWHRPEFLNNRNMAENYITSETVQTGSGELVWVMSMAGLAIIKRSHLWRDLSFQKHITHYHRHLKPYFRPNQDYVDRLELTKKEFPQGNPNLNQMNEDFFSDAVTKLYNHDWLHELFAYGDRPLYTRMQPDPAKAWCDKKGWDIFTHTERLNCIAEEAFVIATERFMVPNKWNYDSKRAFLKAVDKICTTLCSGWFRDYAIDNYPEVVSRYDKLKFREVENHIISLPDSERRYFK